MADDIDRAQAREELDRDFALAAMQRRIAASFAPRDGAVDGTCLDCAEPIEPARLAVLRGCCSRCIGCQEQWEKRGGA